MKLTLSVFTVFAVFFLGGCVTSMKQENANTIDVAQKQIRDATVYRENDPNPYTGVITGFYRNGQKASEEHYVNGKKHGKSLGWHENGQQRLDTNYVDGVEQGMATTWDESGHKLLEIEYVDGEIVTRTDP